MNDKDTVGSIVWSIVGIAWRAILIAMVIYFFAEGIQEAYRYGHGLMYEHAMEASPGTDVNFKIQKGENNSKIAENLEEAGLIDNQEAFLLQSKLYEAEFEPGNYELNTSMTTLNIIEFLDGEGKKRNELAEKNLLDENSADESTGEAETNAEGQEIVGGGDDY